jgi:hypothetical protein
MRYQCDEYFIDCHWNRSLTSSGACRQVKIRAICDDAAKTESLFFVKYARLADYCSKSTQDGVQSFPWCFTARTRILSRWNSFLGAFAAIVRNSSAFLGIRQPKIFTFQIPAPEKVRNIRGFELQRSRLPWTRHDSNSMKNWAVGLSGNIAERIVGVFSLIGIGRL